MVQDKIPRNRRDLANTLRLKDNKFPKQWIKLSIYSILKKILEDKNCSNHSENINEISRSINK